MVTIPPFKEYVDSLELLSDYIDPTVATPESLKIKESAASLSALAEVTPESLTSWIKKDPRERVRVLYLAAGLSKERFSGILNHHLKTSGWIILGREHPERIVEMMVREFDLIRLITEQRNRSYNFGDVLVARAASTATASRAGASGRKLEDVVEAIIKDLRLPYKPRTRFTGKNDLDGPADFVIPDPGNAQIIIACKGNDSTGSKQTATFDELVRVATEVSTSRQCVMAVIDGVGWKKRQSDLRKVYKLWEDHQIDGMYTMATLGQFREDVKDRAIRYGLLPPGS
jgi:DpnII restriction endonuclease